MKKQFGISLFVYKSDIKKITNKALEITKPAQSQI